MLQEQVIRSSDVNFFTPDHLTAVQNALARNPNAANMHFIVNAWGGNIKLTTPVRERFTRYDTQITVALNDIRQLVKDPALFAATVLTRMYYAYKSQLILH